jgi:hypothetical protein
VYAPFELLPPHGAAQAPGSTAGAGMDNWSRVAVLLATQLTQRAGTV